MGARRPANAGQLAGIMHAAFGSQPRAVIRLSEYNLQQVLLLL